MNWSAAVWKEMHACTIHWRFVCPLGSFGHVVNVSTLYPKFSMNPRWLSLLVWIVSPSYIDFSLSSGTKKKKGFQSGLELFFPNSGNQKGEQEGRRWSQAKFHPRPRRDCRNRAGGINNATARVPITSSARARNLSECFCRQKRVYWIRRDSPILWLSEVARMLPHRDDKAFANAAAKFWNADCVLLSGGRCKRIRRIVRSRWDESIYAALGDLCFMEDYF